MKRPLRAIVALLMLAIVAIVTIEWRASYTTPGIRESWLQTPYGVEFGTEAFNGQFQFSCRRAEHRRGAPWGFYQATYRTWGVGFDKGFLGISWGRTVLISKTSPSTDSEWTYLTLPSWLVMLIVVMPPVLVARRVIRHRAARLRTAKGLCLHCGYDLRASADRCPECGHPIHPVDTMTA